MLEHVCAPQFSKKKNRNKITRNGSNVDRKENITLNFQGTFCFMGIGRPSISPDKVAAHADDFNICRVVFSRGLSNKKNGTSSFLRTILIVCLSFDKVLRILKGNFPQSELVKTRISKIPQVKMKMPKIAPISVVAWKNNINI
jgi:hypothetical protein